MRTVKKILISGIAAVIVAACNTGGLDPISSVAPGPDKLAPTISLNYPFEGAKIQVREEIAPINIQFESTDDIELASITLNLDGSKLVELTDFKDYRRVISSFKYNNVTNGSHVLNAIAKDKNGKTASVSVNFQKVEPYKAKYPGEIVYMPFDGDYLELLTLKEGTKGGNPTFVNGKLGKAVHLNAIEKSYVLFPGDTLAKSSNFSLSFFVNPEFVDKDGDGGIDGILGLVNLSNTGGFWGNLDFFVENGSNPAKSKMVVHVVNNELTETWFTELNNVPNFFGNWAHHVVTYDDTKHEFNYYIDSILKYTRSADWTDALTFKNSGSMVFGCVHFQTNPSLTTGSGSQPWASYLTGGLDEIRIFNRALSQADVLQIFNDAN
jgi:Concanavalin A-like lectin/glucanases superfamily